MNATSAALQRALFGDRFASSSGGLEASVQATWSLSPATASQAVKCGAPTVVTPAIQHTGSFIATLALTCRWIISDRSRVTCENLPG